MIVHVKVRYLGSRLSHDNFVDVAKCAAVYLLLVWDVTGVPRQVVLVEGGPIGQKSAAVWCRDRL